MDTLHIELADPYEKSEVSVEEAIAKRKSVRVFKDEEVSFQAVSQLMWAAYGEGCVPSAGAIYPLRLYLVVRKAEFLEPGVYRYWPDRHSLSEIVIGKVELEYNAPITIVIAVDYEKINQKYGLKGRVYAHLEAGHSGQNIYLQALSLGLGTVAVGAFDEEQVRLLLNISSDEEILYLMPVGKAKEGDK
jgi:SagB-type dehydrogenase family enzyme